MNYDIFGSNKKVQPEKKDITFNTKCTQSRLTPSSGIAGKTLNLLKNIVVGQRSTKHQAGSKPTTFCTALPAELASAIAPGSPPPPGKILPGILMLFGAVS